MWLRACAHARVRACLRLRIRVLWPNLWAYPAAACSLLPTGPRTAVGVYGQVPLGRVPKAVVAAAVPNAAIRRKVVLMLISA